MAKVTVKGQVTIPVRIRKALDIEAGDNLVFELDGGSEARVRVVKQTRLSDLYGALAATRPHRGKAAVREVVGRALGRRRLRRSGAKG